MFSAHRGELPETPRLAQANARSFDSAGVIRFANDSAPLRMTSLGRVLNAALKTLLHLNPSRSMNLEVKAA
jgi:hypothetical protein